MPGHERHSRWVHRPRADWKKYARRNDPTTIEGRVYQGLQRLIALRKGHEAFSGGELEIIPMENEHVLGFVRSYAGKRAIVFANFSETPQPIPAYVFDQYSVKSKDHLHGVITNSFATEITIAAMNFVVFG